MTLRLYASFENMYMYEREGLGGEAILNDASVLSS